MEERVSALGAAWTDGPWAIICHSTGALIARRWLLNRLGKRPIPTHLITMAGANHGSTLAQMGESVLGFFKQAIEKHSPTVGANVLIDVDYGSDFLLKLNSEWMKNWNDGSLDELSAFSMGGDFVGNDRRLQIFWETHEPGSDNTVRISSANLNYTLIEVKHDSAGAHVVATRPTRSIPHLVLPGYSHFGSETGILGWVNARADFSVDAVVQALNIQTPTAYADLADKSLPASWAARTQTWMTTSQAAHLAPNGPPSAVNSTAVFNIQDESGRSLKDCVIAILDQKALGDVNNVANPDLLIAAMNNVSQSIMPHSPIQNNVQLGSYSFYFDYYTYLQSSPHWFHIDAALPGLISFIPLIFTQPPEIEHALFPNEFTYVSLTMKRDSSETYAVYGFEPTLDLSGTTWMPFSAPGRISP